MTKIIRRWHAREYVLADVPVKVLLKALLKLEASEFLAGMQELAQGLPTAGGPPMDAQGMAKMYASLDGPFVQEAFKRYVKPNEPLADEEGNAIDDGGKLLALASVGFTQAVLLDLQRLCVNSEDSAKSSASPSTSSQGPGGNTGSPAPSTGNDDGPRPSTATGLRGDGLSSPPA
jgi:hypothetical protein